MIKKLLLIGSSRGGMHLKNYHQLIGDYFDEILIVTGNEIDYCKYEIINFSLKNPLAVVRNTRKLSKIIQAFSPTIIHVHQANSYAFITSLANKGRIPQVLTTWGSDVLILPKKNIFYNYIVLKSLQSSDSITADAQYMGAAINSLIGSSDVVIANFGIDTTNLNADLSVKEDIIYSNRLHNDLYNIHLIIEAFAAFQQIHPSWKLVLAGNGKNTDQLKVLAAEQLKEGSYSFVGFVDGPTNQDYYRRSKLYVSVPTSDGTAISLLEAMAFGTIPVLSDLPANKEWVNNAENGIIVATDLASAMLKALELDPKRVATLNAEIIEKRASKKANKTIFEDVYRELLERKSK
jgi:glycosyltransferase involved in cell wall biosynthesis